MHATYLDTTRSKGIQVPELASADGKLVRDRFKSDRACIAGRSGLDLREDMQRVLERLSGGN